MGQPMLSNPEFMTLAALLAFAIIFVVGCVYTITVLVWKVDALERERTMLQQELLHANGVIFRLRKKLHDDKCAICNEDT